MSQISDERLAELERIIASNLWCGSHEMGPVIDRLRAAEAELDEARYRLERLAMDCVHVGSMDLEQIAKLAKEAQHALAFVGKWQPETEGGSHV